MSSTKGSHYTSKTRQMSFHLHLVTLQKKVAQNPDGINKVYE